MVFVSTWTDDNLALLTKLWADGRSASEIAKALGIRSRNSVIGKVHRLKLPPRATIKRTKPKNHRPGDPTTRPLYGFHMPLFPKAKVTPPKPKREPIPLPDKPTCAPARLGDATPFQCRYIEADCEPCGPDTPVCGAPVLGEESWCPYHYRIVFPPQENRRKRPKYRFSSAVPFEDKVI